MSESDMNDLLRDLRKYVAGSLPTHKARGGEADRIRLLKRIDEALGEQNANTGGRKAGNSG